MEELLKVNDISMVFGGLRAVSNFSMTINKGELIGLIGPNGAGKTTLFNCLTDEVPPDGGTASLVLDDGTRRALTPDDVGYVFATPILPDFLTGYEFVRFYMDVNAARIRDGRSADDYFDMVQIAPEDRHRLIKGYSHGMKNKVQMLCFLIARPPVILLDEPLTSFDVVVALEIKQLLRQIKHEHIIVFSTHILQLATDLCDEIAVLHEGMLSQLDHALLHSGDFEAQLIELLKDEGEA